MAQATKLAKADIILNWYDKHRRHLPWRAPPGVQADPYHVWLSEIMLQQTTVATVKSYFEHFCETWPSVADLAKAPLDDVLHAWQGLGYYARARNLHKCANVVSSEYDGAFPSSESELLQLPGIGPYTAAAIASIAFGAKATPVDGNIERVISRLFAIKTPLPDSKPEIKRQAERMTPDQRAGDYAQALMDIGATICTPKKPICLSCPLSEICVARKKGLAEDIPARVPKKQKPTRVGTAFWLMNEKGEVLLQRRPEKGLLGGMVGLPTSEWRVKDEAGVYHLGESPIETKWQILPKKVRHTFTHFHLELDVAVGHRSKKSKADGFWSKPEDFGQYALPTLMKKIVKLALSDRPEEN